MANADCSLTLAYGTHSDNAFRIHVPDDVIDELANNPEVPGARSNGITQAENLAWYIGVLVGETFSGRSPAELDGAVLES